MNPLPHPRSLACAALLTFLALTCGHAQTVPALVNYQGRLSNPDGSPLPTADYTLTFNLYDAATNGALVWGPQVFDGSVAQGHGPRIPVVQGYFNVMLGPVDTTGRSLADAFSNATRYVEIAVSNRPPILPRQQILTTPFAFQAANSAKLAGYDWSAVFGTNNPVAGTIPFSKLAQRQVGTNVGVGGIAVSQGSGINTVNGAGTNAATNLLVTLVTSGRPVFVGLVADSTSNADSGWGTYLNSSNVVSVFLIIRQNSQPLCYFRKVVQGAPGSHHIPAAASTVAFPPAGTWTYSVFLGLEDAFTATLYNVRLIAYEL